MYDAVVVGAGPAGSMTAARLSRAGFSVLLIDRAVFPRDKACGEYSSPQVESVLARNGALERVLAVGARRLPAMHLISPGGRRFVLEYSKPGDTSGPNVLGISRRALDAALVDHARESGAEVREWTKVDAVTMREGRAAGVVISERGGHVTEIPGRLVIGADGTHSAVARSLGVTAALRWPRNTGMVAHFAGYNGLDDWGEMHVSAQGYAGLAPLPGGVVNVGLVTPMKFKSRQGGGASEWFDRFAYSFPGVAERLSGARRVSSIRGSGPIGARASKVAGPGYLLVGDAAGFFDPFTGEGVYRALRGAELAAGVATQALEANDLSEERLGRYDALRKKEFGAKDAVCRLVQAFLWSPAVVDYVVSRVSSRSGVREVLTGVLGDYQDASAALRPGYLWSLLRP